jgi:hypothetical protein
MSRRRRGRTTRSLLLPLAALIVLLIAGAGSAVLYVLWPTWPGAAVSGEAPAAPITVGGVLFNVPPAAIRVAVQRHPGAQERIDLVFLWPSLTPPLTENAIPAQSVATPKDAALRMGSAGDRLFVTIAIRDATLAPLERLRTIYPHYVEAQAIAGPGGLAILPFRAGTPYEGEDLVYVEDAPEQFFACCTRPAGPVAGTCMHERLLDAAEITFRFRREWLQDWRSVAVGFDRLLASLHPRSG